MPETPTKQRISTISTPRTSATQRSVLDAISRTDTSDLEGHRRLEGGGFGGVQKKPFGSFFFFVFFVFCF